MLQKNPPYKTPHHWVWLLLSLASLLLPRGLSAQIVINPANPTICPGDNVTLTATLLSTGGVGTSSYTFETIPYAPEDFTLGTPVTMTDDDVKGPFPIGFDFCFFNNSYTQFYIGSNGWISFSPGQTTAFTSAAIPSTAGNVPKNCIMFPWQDWHPGTGGNGPYIRYRTVGTAPNRRLIVSFNQCPLFSCTTTTGTFQVVLHETTNIIENHIQDKPNTCTWAGGTATQGVHNIDGTIAYTVPGRNSTVWGATNESTRFVPSGIQWFQGGTLISATPTVTVAPVGTTTYTAQATLCDGTILTQNVTVTLNPPANPTFTLPANQTSVCVDTAPFTLTGGAPAGGTYSGPGVNSATGVFSPSVAGVGTHTITYSYPNCGGIGTATQTITVNPLPTVVFANINPGNSICINAGPITLTQGSPAGGTYSGPGVDSSTSTFDPMVAGLGNKTLTYTYTDANGCTKSAVRTIAVRPVANVTFAPLASVCVTAAPFTLTGGAPPTQAGSGLINPPFGVGTYSGPGVNSATGVFNPAVAGVGTHTITYTHVANNTGCTASATQTITVHPQPTVTFPVIAPVCVDSPAFPLNTATPAGGTYTGAGVTANQFDPLAAGVGVHTITYTYTDANGCTNTATQDITVNPLPTPTCDALPVICPDAAPFVLTFASPPGGVYSGNGVNSGTSTFDPAVAGVGTHTITYTFTDGAGCVGICTTDIVVEDVTPPVAVGQDLTIQLDANGQATITVANIENGSSDNCNIATTTISQTGFDCSHVGANTVTLTVTDIAGNVHTDDVIVTVQDLIPPTAQCVGNFTLQLDASGNASIAVADIDNGSFDNCGIANMTLSQTAFDCTHIGLNTVTLTVTDNNGLVSTCTVDITVEDNIAPAAICQDITVQLDASGNASITPADVDNGSNDACGIASLALDITSFDCTNVGVNPVVLTVTDNNGNVSTCNALVTVEDNVAPAAICQDITVQLDASGNASITAAQINNGSQDACGIASLVLSQTDFDCSHVGANTVTLTVTDNNGNVSTCNALVTVQDLIPPTAQCVGNFTLQLDASGNASIAVADIDNGSFDNCGIANMTLSQTAFDCTHIGLNTVTLTVTDDNGLVSTCTVDITVEDNVAPAAICQDITVQLDASGNASITPADIDNGSNDACGIASLALDITSFDCTNVGVNPVVLTVTDNNGNVSTCNALVTVEDNVAPAAICQDITVQLDANGDASITAAQINNGSQDACGIASLVLSQTDFDCSHAGANTVTLTVTDNNGNSSTCTATVTALEFEPPVAIGQNITVNLDPTGNATIQGIDIDNGSTDNCGIVSYTATPNAFTCANVGANTVTLTVADASNNISTVDVTVTVVDVTPPVALCQNVAIFLDASGNASITPADVDNGSSDACGIASLALDKEDFTCADLGANAVTLTVTDDNGNSNTCTATVTVFDNLAPTAICQPLTIQLDPITGTASITPAQVNNGSFDNCTLPADLVLALDITDFDCTNVGANTVTLTVTDASGNAATCTAVITVEDVTPPTALCQDITVQLDASGNATITPADIDNGSNDACGIASLALDITSFDCSNIGVNPVVLTVTDNNGNIATCNATVTVEDNVLPAALCQNVAIFLDASGNASITPADVDNGSSDACGIASLALDKEDFTCADLGANAVTLTVTDNNGNSNTCTATVTVFDNLAPTAICQPLTIQLDPITGTASITPAQVNNGSFDNCTLPADLVLALDITDFDCTNVGANTVTLTVTDASGNAATCTAVITVEDVTPPTALCQPVTLTLNAAGQATLTVAQVDAGSSDACGIANMTLSKTDFTCADAGVQTVTLTVEDVNGLVSTCDAQITIQDIEAPVISCPANIVVNNDAGACEAVVTYPLPTATDNCDAVVPTLTAGLASGSAFPVGTTTVTYEVVDGSGNSGNCSFTVTVNDTEAPVITCPADIVVNNDAGICGAVVNYNLPTATDNCGVPTITLQTAANTASGSIFPVGVTTVTYRATDAAGNFTNCSFTVTVIDTENPVFVNTPNPVVNLNASTTACSANYTYNITFSDNCPGATIQRTAGLASGSAFPVGTTTVTHVVTDAAGNSATYSFNVVVADVTPPTIVCSNPAPVNNTPGIGVCGAVVNYALPTANDNCGNTTLVLVSGLGTGAIFPLGESFEVYEAIDDAGNVSAQCTVTVVVNTPPRILDADGSTDLCKGESVNLRISPSFGALNVSYEWYHNGVLIPGATGDSYLVTAVDGSEAGTYKVVVDNGCVEESNEIEINVFPTPAAVIANPDASGQYTICAGEVITLNGLHPDHTVNPVTYQWFLNGTPIPSANGSTYDASVAGSYTVKVTYTNGAQCSALSDPILLNLNPLPEITINPFQIVCAPLDSIGFELSDDANFGYIWSGPGIVGNAIRRVIHVADSGYYTVRMINLTTGCESDSTIYVSRNPAPSLGVADTAVCRNTLPAILIAKDLSHADVTYEWYFLTGTTPNALISNDANLQANEEGYYAVRVTDNVTGCISTDTAFVEINDEPDFEIKGYEAPVCNQSVNLYIQATNLNGMLVQWSGTGQILSPTDGLNLVVGSSGTYTVTVIDTTQSTNCATTKSIDVIINDDPIIPVDLEELYVVCESDALNLDGFDPSHEAGASYVWENLDQGVTISDDRTVAITFGDLATESYDTLRYRLTISYPSGCTVADTFYVKFDRKSQVEILVNGQPYETDAPFEICIGETVNLTAQGGTSYTWSTGESSQTIAVKPDSVGIFEFILKGKYPTICEGSTDTVRIKVNPMPMVDLAARYGEKVVVCQDDRISLSAFNPQNVSNSLQYVWRDIDNNVLLSDSSFVTIVFGQNVPNTYLPTRIEVTVFDELSPNLCEVRDTIQVQFERKSEAFIEPYDSLLCLGDFITLTAGGGSSFLWSTGDTTQSITVRPLQADAYHIYTVKATYGNGCDSTEAVAILYVNPLPQIRAHTLDTINICVDDSITLTPSGGVSYAWTHNPFATGAIRVSPKQPTTYYVIGTDANGCQNVDSVFVYVSPNFDLPDTLIACAGDTLTIGQALPDSLGATYLWLPTAQNTPLISVTRSGLYTVRVQMDSCFFERSVLVDFKGQMEVLLENDTTLCFEADAAGGFQAGQTREIHYTVQNTDPAAEYLHVWRNEAGDIISTDTVLRVSEAGKYYLRIVALYGTALSCEYQDSIQVNEICEPRLYIPDGFTPNGDGLNDRFEVFGRHVKDFHMAVFDRWGHPVYRIKAKNIEDIGFEQWWDATHQGKDVPTGVYVWLISYSTPSDKKPEVIQKTGRVVVIR